MPMLIRFVFVFICLAASNLSALTVDELIAKNIEARGGLEKIKAIQSVHETGKLQIGGGGFSRTLDFAVYAKRPAMLRTEASFQGMTAINAYDGSVGWRVFPFRGRLDPEKLSADDLKELQLNADMDGPLVDYKSKGNVVEYQGTEDVDGTDAHKLKVTLKNGDVRYIYLDPDYFLEIRYVDQSRIRGSLQETETDVGNYEQINGVFFPFSIEAGPKGQPKSQKITIDKVEVNVDVDDSIFHFPAASGPKTGR
jgi:outer membrane lipoprotein-sorting protein